MDDMTFRQEIIKDVIAKIFEILKIAVQTFIQERN